MFLVSVSPSYHFHSELPCAGRHLRERFYTCAHVHVCTYTCRPQLHKQWNHWDGLSRCLIQDVLMVCTTTWASISFPVRRTKHAQGQQFVYWQCSVVQLTKQHVVPSIPSSIYATRCEWMEGLVLSITPYISLCMHIHAIHVHTLHMYNIAKTQGNTFTYVLETAETPAFVLAKRRTYNLTHVLLLVMFTLIIVHAHVLLFTSILHLCPHLWREGKHKWGCDEEENLSEDVRRRRRTWVRMWGGGELEWGCEEEEKNMSEDVRRRREHEWGCEEEENMSEDVRRRRTWVRMWGGGEHEWGCEETMSMDMSADMRRNRKWEGRHDCFLDTYLCLTLITPATC